MKPCVQSNNMIKFKCSAEVAELADAPDSKSGGRLARVGSNPTFGTIYYNNDKATS